ncbi:MAG: DUF4179 domain-containing protein [Clostridia bacterium]|nr:DUF4179 domain-containing protein [Clostridia bacterium]
MNDELKERIKFKIAISRMKEEEIVVMKNKKRNISKGIGIAACLVVATTGIVFAKDIGNFFNNIFGGNSSDGVQTAVDNGYIENVEPQYINADGIEISVDSFLIDDYNLDMNFKIKLDNKYDIKNMANLQPYDMKIVDENNEIVFLTREQEKIMYEESKKTGHPNEHPLFWGGYGMTPEIINDHEIMFHLTAYGSEEHRFPKSKKLYVTFTKVINRIGMDGSFKDAYMGNWSFELNVPEEMYNRETVIYRVKSCNDSKTKVGSATLSNTAFKISIPETTTDKVDYDLLNQRPPKKISDMIALQKEYVETSDGKRFEPAMRSDGDGGYSLPAEYNKIVNYSQTFNLTKFDATDELKVHIFTNKGEEIIIEYERRK